MTPLKKEVKGMQAPPLPVFTLRACRPGSVYNERRISFQFMD
jgi:hypothetical protein